MAESYDITYDAAPVGKATMERMGLYCHFSCRCVLPDDGLYRVHVCSGDSCCDLGICVPVDGMFGTDKSLPAKQLGAGQLSFLLLPKDRKPVLTEEKPEEERSEQIADGSLPELTGEEALPETTPEPEREWVAEEEFVPVSEEEPFAYLDRLENAVMETRSGEVGILLPKEE